MILYSWVIKTSFHVYHAIIIFSLILFFVQVGLADYDLIFLKWVIEPFFPCTRISVLTCHHIFFSLFFVSQSYRIWFHFPLSESVNQFLIPSDIRHDVFLSPFLSLWVSLLSSHLPCVSPAFWHHTWSSRIINLTHIL